MAKKKYTTKDMHLRINAAHPVASGEWVVCHEVADSTGHASSRRADAIAMNLWPSRMALHGYEIKVSRSDWLRELKNPGKAELIWKFCDYWWLAVSDPDIVKEGELPEGWGLAVPHGKGLRRIVKAKHRQADPPSWEFMASLLRSALEGKIDLIEIEDRIKQARKNGVERGKREAESNASFSHAESQRLKKIMTDFEEVTGFKIDSFSNGENIGRYYNTATQLQGRFGKDAFRVQIEQMLRLMSNMKYRVELAERSAKATIEELDRLSNREDGAAPRSGANLC